MVIQAFGVTSLAGLGKFLCVFVCILVQLLNLFLYPFLTLYSFHDHFYSPLSTFYALKLLSYPFLAMYSVM
jgi:hypothetical protein